MRKQVQRLPLSCSAQRQRRPAQSRSHEAVEVTAAAEVMAVEVTALATRWATAVSAATGSR